jgi:hypothetical protein
LLQVYKATGNKPKALENLELKDEAKYIWALFMKLKSLYKKIDYGVLSDYAKFNPLSSDEVELLIMLELKHRSLLNG